MSCANDSTLFIYRLACCLCPMLSVAVHCISCLYRNSSPGLSLVVTEVYDFAVQSDSDVFDGTIRVQEECQEFHWCSPVPLWRLLPGRGSHGTFETGTLMMRAWKQWSNHCFHCCSMGSVRTTTNSWKDICCLRPSETTDILPRAGTSQLSEVQCRSWQPVAGY